jgi:hypothetical protein
MKSSFDATSWRRVGLVVSSSVLLLLAAGCQTYQQQTAGFTTATKTGSLAAAVATINQKAAASKGSKDEIVWRLEQGATLRSAALADPSLVPPPPGAQAADASKAGEPPVPPRPPTPDEVHRYYFARSTASFDLAEARVNDYEEQAKVKVGSEVGAALTNQATLPYRGRAYDKVMMDTYKAINYLQLGDKDRARVELNRALQRQRDAVADNEKRIAAAQDESKKAKNGELKDEKGQSAAYDSDKAQQDPKTSAGLQAALESSTVPLKPYGNYVNPFAVFLDGLFFTTLGEGGSDWERGRKSFERVAGMVPENPYLQEDLSLAANVAEGKAAEGLTYVIFETGAGPFRDQVRIDIPTFLVSDRLAYVGAAFPKLRFNGDCIGTLGITAGGRSLSTATVASMDSVVANDFKNEWPTIVTKTIITTATKAILQATTQKQLDDRGGAFGSLLGKVAGTVINSSTNIADTRAWTSLPKEFQYARLATPADRQLTITAGPSTQTISLEPGSVNVVYVKSMTTASPLLVSQFVLK